MPSTPLTRKNTDRCQPNATPAVWILAVLKTRWKVTKKQQLVENIASKSWSKKTVLVLASIRSALGLSSAAGVCSVNASLCITPHTSPRYWVAQSCPWVHFVWPNPTKPNTSGRIWTRPNTTNNGAYSLVVTYFYTKNLSCIFCQPSMLFTVITHMKNSVIISFKNKKCSKHKVNIPVPTIHSAVLTENTHTRLTALFPGLPGSGF